MVAAPGSLHSDVQNPGSTIGGPVRLASQPPASPLHLQIPLSPCGSDQRSPLPVAGRSTLRLLPLHYQESHQETASGKGGSDPRSAILALQAVVLRPHQSRHPAIVAPSALSRSAASGSPPPSRPPVAPTLCLEVERVKLKAKEYSKPVQDTILASRRPSTNHIYQATWSAFLRWAHSHKKDSLVAGVPEVLAFLQAGLNLHLHPSTLKRQASALASVLNISSSSAGQPALHSHVSRFLRGAANLAPPPIKRFSSWNLNQVLNTLTKAPFEPIDSIPLKVLSYKVLFLVAIASACRISRLGALSARKEFCTFQSDAVNLQLDPTFLPKVNTAFHRTQVIVLPSSPVPTHPK
ncbi:uncharacterized protein LOC128342137 isoform X1 [Hemicordylus capensis]|uniref:uncharacterized protein LOC128342137 isoform X1 n=1 Tax=Hemicordylus capensis TaxID=884348 RepID=UPI0023046416|nr:uncharacterized protein LOC128342137 isoform X1 [Hemicordylus capensis]XP_053145021.1 uncharacterized protein LOC128342137 isoform X1 [Hemicordylus capensis]